MATRSKGGEGGLTKFVSMSPKKDSVGGRCPVNNLDCAFDLEAMVDRASDRSPSYEPSFWMNHFLEIHFMSLALRV